MGTSSGRTSPRSGRSSARPLPTTTEPCSPRRSPPWATSPTRATTSCACQTVRGAGSRTWKAGAFATGVLLLSTQFATAVTLVVYSASGTLRADVAFPIIAIFQALRAPFIMLPLMVTLVTMIKVAAKRSSRYLLLPEQPPLPPKSRASREVLVLLAGLRHRLLAAREPKVLVVLVIKEGQRITPLHQALVDVGDTQFARGSFELDDRSRHGRTRIATAPRA